MSKPKTDTYDVIYSRIRRITKLRTAEGDIRFTATMKLIYAYIWTFQENKNRGNDDPIHTNTNVIAWEVGVSEKAAIDALKALDAAKVVIKRTAKVRGNVNSSNYTAIPPASVAVLGITPPHPDESKSKLKEKKAAEPTNEEKKGDDESDQGNAGKRDGVSDVYSDQHDDISANDAVNERYYADLDTLNNWVEGYDDEGFMAYGAMWGIAKPGAITDLIKSHIRKIQSDGYKGSRSAANDEPSGADAIYKQQQAQRAAAAKQGANAQPTQAWDENQPF
ncbi:hypothetical protein [Pseudenterobacter timonensis]|uniref:hypothetical protein n=1 Tax=Pseudenterobacter timonensis TaxID=1755099 RepID=UPI00077B816D|nr:hypothetical protein [Pseudenterobacter timonensis]